jgi:flagellar basal-body rod protein FlgF
MESGYYAACAGLRAQTQALELIASNVANINTAGYRGQQPLFTSWLASASGELTNPLNYAINNFNVLGGSRTDLSAGSLERTGNPLDLGIEGSGFFVVQTEAGPLYTRNGNFQASPRGQLTTAAGELVLGEQGPITLPAGPVSISADGTLSVNGAVAGRLRMVEFVPGALVEPVGNSHYSAPASATRAAVSSYMRQGTLESSNINAVSSVVDLITVQRRAEMLERAMAAFHNNFDHIATSELARV